MYEKMKLNLIIPNKFNHFIILSIKRTSCTFLLTEQKTCS